MMLNSQVFLSRWHSLGDSTENLVRYDPICVETLAIPEEARRFLIEAGLPRYMDTNFTFDIPPNPEAYLDLGKKTGRAMRRADPPVCRKKAEWEQYLFMLENGVM